MRIVKRAEFLTLPPGTVYREGEPWAFGDLTVKWDTLGTNDWVQQNFEMPESKGSDQLFDRLDEMLEAGARYPLDPEDTMRNGAFEEKSIFIVYERDDLVVIRDAFNAILREDETT